jgi:hypothetical protein
MTDPTPTTSHGLPAAFLANNFPEELAELYRTTFLGLRRDAEARPGMATLQAMVCERAAHGFARLKAYDASLDPIYPPDYDRASKSFAETLKSIIATAKDGDDDETTLRLVMSQILNATVDAADASVAEGLISEDDRRAFLQTVSDRLRQAYPG